jgi:hypothetical protein
MIHIRLSKWLGVLLALAAAPALPQVGSSASVTIGSGPHEGKYDFAPTETCVITAFGKRPPSLSVVLSSTDASLSVDMPNIDEQHAHQIQVVLVVSDVKPGQVGRTTASVTYEIDTRPDNVLEPFKKAERANKGISGKATTQLMTQGNNAMLSFSGETTTGVKLSGEVSCRKVESS